MGAALAAAVLALAGEAQPRILRQVGGEPGF